MFFFILCNMKYVVGVVGGIEKIDVICGVLKGKFIYLLIIDEEIVFFLLWKDGDC